jgi:Flp pilus assembly protein TadG
MKPNNPTSKAWLSSQPRKFKRGSATVELALIAPLLMLMMFGLIQYGIIWNSMVSVSQLTRDATRYAAVHGTEAGFDGPSVANGTSLRSYIMANCSNSAGLSYANIGDSHVFAGYMDNSTNPPTFVVNTVGTPKRKSFLPITVEIDYDLSQRIYTNGLVPGVGYWKTNRVTKRCTMMIEKVPS